MLTTVHEKNETKFLIRKAIHTQKRTRLMNLFFDILPTDLQASIYTYDNTYSDKFDNVIRQLEYKQDLAASCGYRFPRQSLEGLLTTLI